MSITNYAEYSASLKANTLTIADAIAFYNAHKPDLTAEQGTAILAWADRQVTAENEEACVARMDSLLGMDRAAMWKDYSVNPSFKGIALQEKDGALELAEKAILIKFAKFEKHYQTLNSVEKDEKGQPKPNKAVSICRDGHYVAMARILNAYLALETASDISAVSPAMNKDKLTAALGDAGEVFVHNNKKNRIAMLQAIISAMLPEECAVNVLSCDISYLKLALAKVKGRKVTGIGDKAFIDFIVNVIACALSYDAESKKRTLSYEYVAKASLLK